MDWKIFRRPFEKIARSFRTKTAKKKREKRQREKRRKVGFWYGDKGCSGRIVESGDTVHWVDCRLMLKEEEVRVGWDARLSGGGEGEGGFWNVDVEGDFEGMLR
jgi:hypothetical protein